MNYKISVIITVYNKEKYLKACLDSVLAQTITEIEIICINDGSTDYSGYILEEYARKDHRIKVIKQKNRGLSLARNKGLSCAKGAYIFFVDADDLLPQNALETLFKIAKDSGVPLVASETDFFKKVSFGYKISHYPLVDFVHNRRIFSSSCNKLYRADILKRHRFIPGIYFEDWPFITTLMGKIDCFATTKVPCYFYRKRENNITTSAFDKQKVDSYFIGIKYVYDFYSHRDDLKWAQKRMAIAVKMMISKVYKSKNKDLILYTLSKLFPLFRDGIILRRHLPCKTNFRILKMKLCSGVKI